MTDQPVTPDREALEQANGDLPRREFVMLLWRYGPTMDPDVAGRLADRFLAAGWSSPEQVAEALDRARQQGKREGREEAAQAIERKRDDSLYPTDADVLKWFTRCARLARGGPNRKDGE